VNCWYGTYVIWIKVWCHALYKFQNVWFYEWEYAECMRHI